MELNIFNQQEEKVAILSTAQNGSHVPVYDANIEEKLDSYDILTFTIDADTEESTYAVEGNTIVFKDIKGWREYYITNVEEEDGDILQKTITAELSMIELADEIIEKDLSGTTTNPKVALASLLEGTRFEVGIVDESIYNKRFNTDTFYLNVLEAISELASEYSAEVQVSYQIKDGKIEKRLINLYKQFGRNNGKRFEIEKDITSIKRTVDISQLKTAIIPFTDEKTSQDEEGNESSGSRITINDVVWSKAKGDPTDKPLGQNYLEDKTALANFGRIGKDGKLKHKKLSMEINVDSAEALISMAWVQLARYSTPKVTYEVKAVDLYELIKDEDFKHEQIFLGDTIIAVDKNFAVPIVIETRVVEVKRDLLDATNNEYVFGTSKELFSYQEQLDSIEEKIKDVVINIDNIQQNADGFTTTYRGSTQPATARENDLWYRPHPTIVGERQMLIFNGTTWEIASDTSVKGLVDKDILEVQNDTQLAIKKAQDAVDLAESVEGSLIFKVGTEEYNAKMTTLEDNINLRVTKNDVIHQINISDEQILIAGDKIIISGDTTVDGSFKVTNQMIADGISADKITAGTINGQTVNIVNVNADNITGGNLDIQNMNIKNGNQTILSVNQAGEVVMNVTSLKIGQFNAVTSEELKKLEAQYTFTLTNDSVSVPTDKDGNNGDYSTATTQPTIYKLGVLDTANWTITATSSTGMIGALSGGKYTLTNMTTRTGTVTFTARKDGLTLTKVFTVSKALAGSTGDPGKDGVAGKDGKGVKSTTITYASSTSGTTAPTTNWSSAVPTVAPGNFLWTRTIWIYTDDSSEIGYTVSYIATNGNDGSNGIAGKDGVGIKTTTITYASSTSGTTTPTSGWTTTIPTVSAGNYLWTKTIWTYTDNTTETGYSVARMGVNGSTGATGNGISSIAKRYLVSSLNTGITTATAGWTTTMQVTTPTNKYLWSYEEVSYTDGTKVPTTPVIIGTHGENGQNSVIGLLTNESITLPANKDGLVSSFTGANGVFEIYDGITKKTGTGTAYSIVTQSNITVSINATTGAYTVTAMPTGTTILNGYATLRAIYNGVTIEKQLNVSKSVTGATGATGSQGSTGASATSYWITASNNIIGKSQTGVINPTTITFKGFSKTGTANSVAYSGRFIIQTSTNGTTYTTRYTSSADQNSYTYTIPTDSLFVKCLFYMAGGTTVLLDEQTVPIVESAEGIQVGGENLYTGSKDFSTTYTNMTTYSKVGTYLGFKVMKKIGQWNGLYQTQTTTEIAHYTLSAWIKTENGGRINFYGNNITKSGTFIPTGEDWTRVSCTFETTGSPDWNARFENIVSGGTIYICGLKLEKGNIPTDWRPHPEDARTYKRWANSSDGTVDFTGVYPNENLIIDTKFDGESWSSYASATLSYPIEDGTKNIKMVKTGTGKQGILTAPGLEVEKGVEYTISYQARGTVRNFYNYMMLSPGPNYAFYIKAGVLNPTTFTQISHTFTVPTSLTGSSVNILFTDSAGVVGEWLEIKGGTVKLERGTTPTIYTTNTADSLTGSVPKYVGFSPLDSNKPSDYEWIINPEWTQASAEESLTNKADKGEIDDINNALGDKADQGVVDGLQEILENLKGSYEGFVSEGGGFEQGLKNLEAREASITTSLKDKVSELEFIKTYMRFGEEGFMMGEKDSPVKMLLKNNGIYFTDGGQNVAYFSNQEFHINRGAVVESLQVGKHKMTDLGNGHTVIQFIKE